MAAHLSAFIERADALANAVDQNVPIMDGGEPLAGRGDLNPAFTALIAARAHVRFGRKGEYRVFHRRHISLWHSIHDVTDEQIALRMPVRQERRACRKHSTFIRHFTHQNFVRGSSLHTPWTTIVTSHTGRQDSSLYTLSQPVDNFASSSSLHTPQFVTSHTNFGKSAQFRLHFQSVT